MDVAILAGLFEMDSWSREVGIIQLAGVMIRCGGVVYSAHALWPLGFFIRQMLKSFLDKWLFYCLFSDKVVFIELT